MKIIPPKPDKDGKIAFVKFYKEAGALCVAQYMSNYECSDGTTLMVSEFVYVCIFVFKVQKYLITVVLMLPK